MARKRGFGAFNDVFNLGEDGDVFGVGSFEMGEKFSEEEKRSRAKLLAKKRKAKEREEAEEKKKSEERMAALEREGFKADENGFLCINEWVKKEYNEKAIDEFLRGVFAKNVQKIDFTTFADKGNEVAIATLLKYPLRQFTVEAKTKALIKSNEKFGLARALEEKDGKLTFISFLKIEIKEGDTVTASEDMKRFAVEYTKEFWQLRRAGMPRFRWTVSRN